MYRPGVASARDSKSAAFDKAEPPRAYGSMTYAGMQSLIYANVDKNDPRVKLALKWLENSYNLDENPGMGVQGLYYYYQPCQGSQRHGNRHPDAGRRPQGGLA